MNNFIIFPVFEYLFSRIFAVPVIMAAFVMFGTVQARTVTVNTVKIEYDGFLAPQCAIFIRHTIGNIKAGWSVPDLCDKYRRSGEGDVIDTVLSTSGGASIPVRKSDFESLDDLRPWTGVTPIRAFYGISRRQEDPDPDVSPSYLPYDNRNKITNYIVVDGDGYEVGVADKKRSGYRFYEFLGWCYLATEKKPRKFKYFTQCKDLEYNSFPKSVDTVSRPWINITQQNTVDLGERMPADGVEIRGSTPVKPMIYSDFPIGNNGRVTKGRAMCMADCAPGMLMKLLHAGQSIWGPSGRPADAKE